MENSLIRLILLRIFERPSNYISYSIYIQQMSNSLLHLLMTSDSMANSMPCRNMAKPLSRYCHMLNHLESIASNLICTYTNIYRFLCSLMPNSNYLLSLLYYLIVSPHHHFGSRNIPPLLLVVLI